MRRPRRSTAPALAVASAALVAGCGGAAPAVSGPAPEVTTAGARFLATALVTPAGTWAVAVMGGSVASHNNFWQLFIRPVGSGGSSSPRPACPTTAAWCWPPGRR